MKNGNCQTRDNLPNKENKIRDLFSEISCSVESIEGKPRMWYEDVV